jgi:hypothetical protein
VGSALYPVPRHAHPADMGEREINEFLTWLAVEQHVSSSTQTQALSALLFSRARAVMTGRVLHAASSGMGAERPVCLTRASSSLGASKVDSGRERSLRLAADAQERSAHTVTIWRSP